MLYDGHLRRPVRTPTYTVHGDSVLVDLGPGGNVIENAREHTLGIFTDFDGTLPGARTIDGEEADAERQNRAEALGQIFLAAVQSIHGEHERHRPVRIFRQSQVADDFLALEWNFHNLERRIPEARVRQESLDGFFVGTLFAGGCGNGPASEGIEPPRADVVGIRLGRVGLL